MIKYRVLGAIASLVVLATPVPAEIGRHPWGQAGDWAILVDRDAGSGCFMEKLFKESVKIRFGFLPEQDGGFFSALSSQWEDVEPGSTGVIKFIAGEAKFAGEVEMIEEDGWNGGSAFFNNPDFAVEMARQLSVTVIGPRGRSFEVDLAGSARAIREMERCQAEQG